MATHGLARYGLYTLLFVLTAGTMHLAFGVLFLFTSFMFWLVIPSALVYSAFACLSFLLFGGMFLLAQRRRWGCLKAISLGGLSFPVLVVVLMLLGPLLPSPPREQKPNQREPLPSPSGQYVLTVPIERSDHRKGPFGYGMPFWHVTISGPNGAVLYRDPEDEFHGIHNVYWVWDDQDRVWLYNSDDGGIYFYECLDDVWQRQRWGHGTVGRSAGDIVPPEALYPPYVHKSDPGPLCGIQM